jgi:hypothetical protein
VLTPQFSSAVPFHPLKGHVHQEIEEYLQSYTLNFKDLSLFVRSIETDGKDLPILLKQYWKMRAQFFATAVDQSFLETPGLLLLVDMPNAPDSSLKMYLDKGAESYVNYRE